MPTASSYFRKGGIMGGRQCFLYNGVSGAQYGLWAGYVNDSPDDNDAIQTPYSYELAISPTLHTARITNTEYEETFTFQMEIISDIPVNPIQEREILGWLIDSPSFKRLELFTYGTSGSYFDRTHYNCILTNPRRIYGNAGIVGWVVSVITDAPYAWADRQVYSYQNFPFIHFNRSDEPAYTYPAVEIVIGSKGGSVSVKNVTTGETFSIKEVSDSDTIRIDEYRQVTALLTPHIYDKCSGKIRLVRGVNQFEVTGDIARIALYYADARKVGYC